MTDIHASLGIEQLKKLDVLNEKRINTASKYNEHLSKYEISFKSPVSRMDSSIHSMGIHYLSKAHLFRGTNHASWMIER